MPTLLSAAPPNEAAALNQPLPNPLRHSVFHKPRVHWDLIPSTSSRYRCCYIIPAGLLRKSCRPTEEVTGPEADTFHNSCQYCRAATSSGSCGISRPHASNGQHSIPSGHVKQRQRQEEPPENNTEEADERSLKRSKIGEVEVQPGAAPDDLALAAAVAAAMQSPEHAVTFHEAGLANFSGYNPLGSLADAGTEMTACDVGGVGAPSLDELLQRVQTQVISTNNSRPINFMAATEGVRSFVAIVHGTKEDDCDERA